MRSEFIDKINLLLEKDRKAVLSTCGPAGVQAGLFACHYQEGVFFVLVPSTADILDNLSMGCEVLATAPGWQMNGIAILCPSGEQSEIFPEIYQLDASHYNLVKIKPRRIQLSPHNGWGFAETIDFE